MSAEPVSPADTLITFLEDLRDEFEALIGGMPPEMQAEYRADSKPHLALNAARALLAVGERDKAEIERLRDRAVCSGCGQDVGESGICTYGNCCDDFACEMIPASDLPHALMVLCDRRVEERDEWRSDWEALRAEAKALEIAGERDRRQIAQLTEALAFYADEDNYFETYPDETQVPVQCPALADEGARARAVLADEEDAANG